jgi:hypothetical protein
MSPDHVKLVQTENWLSWPSNFGRLVVEHHGNFGQNAAALAVLSTSQFLDVSQYEELDARLGLPKRRVAKEPS